MKTPRTRLRCFSNGWRRWFASWWAVVALVSAGGARAQPIAAGDVPPALRPWVPWVLDAVGDQTCLQIAGAHVCSFPGLLRLDLNERGGRFSLSAQVDRTTIVQLPGSTRAWPQDVRVGSAPALVFESSGAPRVSLAPGTHVVTGRFPWHELPESLRIPPRAGLVSLRVNQRVLAHPKRDPELLWLAARTDGASEADNATLEVFRLLHDGVPFRVTTRLVLHVSGQARELVVGNVLLDGSTALAVESPLPTRMDDGVLSIQASAGNHEVTIESVYPTPPEQLRRVARAAPWPATEVWAFRPDAELRQVDVSGAPSIDPRQSHLPEPWRELAAFRLSDAQQLTLRTARRGEPRAPPNALTLHREAWLDLDGQSFTVRDRFGGKMSRDWRLDLRQGKLGFASVGSEPQLVTQSEPGAFGGVELRQGAVDAVFEWRMPAQARRFPAVGWSTDVQQASARLHLPPGWQLLTASGVDRLSDTWLSSWDLLELFFVLIIALATAKLTRVGWGGLALVALVAAHQQEHAPYASWLAVLLVVALLRLRLRGWMRRAVRLAAWLTIALVAGSLARFGVHQVRSAVYPQSMQSAPVERGLVSPYAPGGSPAAGARGLATLQESSEADESSLPSTANYEKKRARVQAKSLDVQRLRDPTVVIQTGPGVPDWSWRTWSLQWSGPVHRDHELSLYLLSPGGSFALALLRVLSSGLLGFLLLRFVRHLMRRASEPPSPRGRDAPQGPSTSATSVVIVLAGCMAPFAAAPASAAEPSERVLGELREKLLRKPACRPGCTSVSRLELAIQGNELALAAEVVAAAVGTYQLPGPLQNWTPQQVTVDGQPATSLVRGNDGFLHLRLSAGAHRVKLAGPLEGSELTLLLGTRPHGVHVVADGWSVDGLSESGQVKGSLQLRRERGVPPSSGEEGVGRGSGERLPAWLRVTRTFRFGVDFGIQTVVERLSPIGTPVLMQFPLLEGERVTRADVQVERGEATLRMARDQRRFEFSSALRARNELRLRAPPGQRYSQRWVVQCGPMWRCTSTGLDPVRHQRGGKWEPEFQPWPSEEVLLTIRRPEPVSGATATVDSAELAWTPGVRLLKAQLGLRVRASSRRAFTVDLPPDAEVRELSVNRRKQPFQWDAGRVAFHLPPGQHAIDLGWQQPGGMTARFRAPAVSVGDALVNARVTVHLPAGRWLLFASGPGWGPAILFWAHLIFVVMLAPLLARLPSSPLRAWQWALLLSGLTQVPMVAAAAVVAWFFGLAHVERWRPRAPLAHNACQLLLALGTLVFLSCLFAAVYDGLLSTPDMEVAGQQSTGRRLTWYLDRSAGALPAPGVVTAPLWVWRATMLGWALWLAHSLLSWLRWGWRRFTSDTGWKPLRRRSASGASVSAAGSAETGGSTPR